MIKTHIKAATFISCYNISFREVVVRCREILKLGHYRI